MSPTLVAALYKFVALPDYAALQAPFARAAAAGGVTGSLLLAEEGINGTLAGPPTGLRAFLDTLRADPRLADLTWKESWADAPPFGRLKIRLKREIVSMGAPGIVSPETVGTYAPPEAWNALIADPEVAVIDVRNDYEVAIGRFEGAVDPQTASFRAFPAWFDQWRAAAERPPRAVAMYCTGGIRCEKATALARAAGVEAVYHLDGGILRYLEEIPAEQSLWRGDCFVFDERVSVGHGLAPGPHTLCRGCRRPLTPTDRAAPEFQEGVCCARCADQLAPEQAAARVERQRQIALATARGARHLGPARRTQGEAD